MVTTVTQKMTFPELDVLDWLMHKLNLDSRSQALRYAMMEVAEREELPKHLFDKVRAERENHLPRRSPSLAQKIGKRQRGNSRAAIPL